MDILGRGGMSKNPFGGEERIDRINLMEFLEPNAAPDKVLFLRIIQDAASNYLYALLGKNGTSIDEFFYAHQYFFKVSSTNQVWTDKSRVIHSVYTDNGQKIHQKKELLDTELKLMCFDRHYDLSGMSDYMHIDRFRINLKKKRRRIISDNWEQVKSYVTTLYNRELNEIREGVQIPLPVWNNDMLDILVDPPTPQHLANIIYIPSKLKKQKKLRNQDSGMYSALADKLERQTKSKLALDWGPLATLLQGNIDAQSTTNDSSDSILCSPNRHKSATSSGDGG